MSIVLLYVKYIRLHVEEFFYPSFRVGDERFFLNFWPILDTIHPFLLTLINRTI